MGYALIKRTLTFFVVATVLIAWGCQKEDTANMGNPDKNGNSKIPSCAEAKPTNATVLELMVNPDDADDTKINYILYHYAQAVRKAMENPTKRCQLLNAMLAQEGDGEISLLEFSTENPSFGAGLNADIKQSISENNVYPKGVESGIDAMLLDPNWDANTYLRNKFKYEETEEEPIVHFIKRPVECETNRPVVVVIGTDVNDCDDVAGWRGNTEILMGEGEANATSEIVIFVGVGERGNVGVSTLKQTQIENFSSMATASRGITAYGELDVDEHQIYKRYDNSKKSEVAGILRAFDPNEEDEDGFFSTAYWIKFNPRKIHKNDIGYGSNGTFYTEDKDLINESDLEFDEWALQFIIYEFDWYASGKKVGTSCDTGNTFDTGTKRKHSTDVYDNDCTTNGDNWFPSIGSIYETANPGATAYFKIIRKS